MRHFSISWQISAHLEFDGSNISQKSLNRATKRLEKWLGLRRNSWRIIFKLIEISRPGRRSNLFCGLMNQNLEICFGNHLRLILCTEEEKGPYGLLSTLKSSKLKSLHFWWYGGTFVPMKLATCTSEKTPSVSFHWKTCIYQQDTTKPYIASITTAWFCSTKVLDLFACIPGFSPTENSWWPDQQLVSSIPRCLQTE